MHNIRLATPAGLPRLVEFYNQAIASHTATADTIPFTIEARRGWFASHAPIFSLHSPLTFRGSRSILVSRGRG